MTDNLSNHNILHKPNWCPGCGNFGILSALKKAFEKLSLPSHKILLVEGIGCHGHMVNFIETNHFEGLHGRPLAVAQGAKLANHDLNVFVISGDGDFLGEGGNHFLHALRRNINLTCLLFNNQRYSLTTGQASPTTEKGDKTKTSPQGLIEEPLNPVALAIANGGTFAARSFSGDILHLTDIIIKAHQHEGLAIVDILQPCISFNKLNTVEYFRKRLYKLEEISNYQADNRLEAYERALEWGDKIPIGVFYRKEKQTYENALLTLTEGPLVSRPLGGIDLEGVLKEYR
ncbi:2-oxoacid:ferredoxin oxidoreductase subunit beta [Patescibacteria group bacterium]|nr:2-oxoacid:ferredoxin oxidoreductase subunit beta [Patescibacteria group bacterium]